LRPWHESDADALVARINDPDIAAFLDRVPHPYTPDDAREWFTVAAEGWESGKVASFGIELAGLEGAAGGVGVHFFEGLDEGAAEIGYWVAA
jgi:RimJ/RimL family protein N-acetyltransferase